MAEILQETMSDGFDHYPDVSTAGLGLASCWLNVGGGVLGTSLVPGLSGIGQAMRTSPGASSISPRRPIMPTEKLSLAMAFRIDAANVYNGGIIALTNAAVGFRLGIALNPMNQLILVNTEGPVAEVNILAQGTLVLAVGARNHMSIMVDLDPVGGGDPIVKVALNGERDNPELEYQGPLPGSGDLAAIRLPIASGFSGFNSGTDKTIDDLYLELDQAVLLPEVEIVTQGPQGTDEGDWTPLTGVAGTDNHLMVDETLADGDVTYNHSDVIGARDIFTFADLPFVPEEIRCVTLLSCLRKEESATRIVKPVSKISGNYHYGHEYYNTTSYGYDYLHHRVNPETGIAWTYSQANAYTGGYENTAVPPA